MAKKLIDDPTNVVEEMIDGYVKAHPTYIKQLPDNDRSLVTVRSTNENKVGILIGGGSGHEPAFMGYVGDGMADGVAVGNIFASPPPAPILAVTKAIDKGAGVVYLYGNDAGDVINFGMAAELADMEGIQVEMVLATDDVGQLQLKKRKNVAVLLENSLFIKQLVQPLIKDTH